MELESASRYPLKVFESDDGDNVTRNSVTSMNGITSDSWVNSTAKKLKCAISEDVTDRITVVSVIMVCTIVGNLTLILALTCKRSRRIKRVNVFLVNLAIGDLAVAFLTNTTEILFLAFGDWALGPAACKITVYMQIVTLASATFLLTAMSMDRYQVIVKPFESLARRPHIWMKVATAWIMAFVFATPQLFIFLQVTEDHDGVIRRCCVSKGYTGEWQRKVYLSFLTSYILLVPTAVMIYCYANIIHVIWIRARAEDGAHGTHGEKEESAGSPRMSVRRGLVTASKRRVITMTLTVVAGFLLCQTPYFIVSLVRVYSDYRIKLPTLLSLSENIVLMHSALNPVLYGLFTLRSYHLTALLRMLTCRKIPLSASGSVRSSSNGGRGRSSSHHHNSDSSHRSRQSLLLPPCGKREKKLLKCRPTGGGGPHKGQQVYQETPMNDVTAKQRNGPRCQDRAACKDSSPCIKRRTVGAAPAYNITTTTKTEKRPEKGLRAGKEDNSACVPLLLVTNNSPSSSPTRFAQVPRDVNSEHEESTPVPHLKNSPALKWRQSNPANIQNNCCSKTVPSSVFSPWTSYQVDSKTECNSCV